MSKDTPEAGDVFQSVVDPDVRIHIVDNNKNGCVILVSDKREVWDINEWLCWKDDYIYLGKSIASVDDLFKV